MEANINEVMDYYARANISFLGAFTSIQPPKLRQMGTATYPGGAGIVFPLSGSARFTLNGTPYVIRPGMVVHAGPAMRLDREVIGNEQWRFAVTHYHIPQNEIEQFPLYRSHFSFPIGSSAKVPILIEQLLQNQSVPGAAALFRSKLLFTTLLGEVFVSSRRRLADDDSALAEQIMEYMRQNYADQITIAQTSSRFGLDRRRLAALFERHVGMTPSNYLIECRILKAKELLCSCSCPIKQVAECVGYSDSLYFSKAFKKLSGLSPSEFRANMPHGMEGGTAAGDAPRERIAAAGR